MDIKSKYINLIDKGKKYQNIVISVLILVSIFFLGLGLGLLIKPGKPTPIIIDKNVKIGLPVDNQNLSSSSVGNFTGGNFVASINGKAYYPMGCKAANIIKEENRIWFESVQEAEADGYARAKNCP